MKRINLYIISCIAVAVFLSSCKKFLDFQSPSRLNVEEVYGSVENTNFAILSVYSRAAGRNVYGGNLPTVMSTGADEFWLRADKTYDRMGGAAISTYSPSAANSTLYNTFVQLYEGIERANIACKQIPLSRLYTSGTAEEKSRMRCYLGEAMTLRALFYFELIRHWGDVPASFVPAADRGDQFFSHAGRDSTYDRILDDLAKASELVGWRSELSGYKSFRITKAAVKGLRARIALFRGGYSLRIKTRMMERGSDYQKYYKIALDECSSIIQSGQHALNPVYDNIFKSLHSGTARYDDANEIIFEIAMWGNVNDGDLARSYGMGFSKSEPWGDGGGGATAVATYFYEFARGTDVRRDVTLANFEIKDGPNKRQVTSIRMYCGKFRKSWTAFDKNSPNQPYGVNWPVLRYADILLMYAEAANELQDFSGPLLPMAALDMVQKRAYVGNPAPGAPADKDGFFNALVKERLLEFGGEGIRKYDLIRWNLLDTKIKEVKANLRKLAVNAPTDNNPYANYPDFIYFRVSAPFKNGLTADEVKSLDLYGGIFDTVYYTRTTVNPGGTYASVYWRRELGVYTNGVLGSADYIEHQYNGYMNLFEPNKKELLPYPDRVIIENRGGIVQNFGTDN